MNDQLWDVDFTLALHNRTGKYFIGRDILHVAKDLVGRTRYGRFVCSSLPSGLSSKVIGRLGWMEARLRMTAPGLIFGLRPHPPVLHLDPQTAVQYDLNERDMVLCHDMGPITHPDLFTPQVVSLYHFAYDKIAQTRPKMVFVSQASKDAFVAKYGPTKSMKVIYPPLRLDLSCAKQIPIDWLTGPFFLTVGSIGDRKNQLNAIEGFAKSGLSQHGISYVLCGVREPGSDMVVLAAEQTPGVLLLPYVSDGILAWLYANAEGFILTSRLEGFGIPVAEAIANGVIPIVSQDSVLEEVAGPGAFKADPEKSDTIASAFNALHGIDQEERRRRRTLLSQSVERFNFDRFRSAWRGALGAPL